jgi:uncharacterized protein YndB with AHSA1/START domain
MTTTKQVYEIYIRASQQAVWDAITSPEWNDRYGYRGKSEYELKKGGKFQALPSADMMKMGITGPIIDGEVIEADPPNKLVQTYRFLFSPQQKEEGFTRLTWEVAATDGGFTRLTVIHDVEGAPMMADAIKSKFSTQGTGGWSWILSDMKSVLETGKTLFE